MSKSEKFWDRLSRNYDKPDTIIEVTEFKSIEYVHKYLNSSDIVLDFGCATGTIASSIAEKVKEIHGIDISSKMIQIAENRAIERRIENIYFSQSTIFDNRYKRDSFNMILSFSILHLLENTDKIMQRIHELLKPGGFFISLTPCLGEKMFLSNLLGLIRRMGILPYIRRFKISELEKSIIEGSFQLVESKCIDNNPLEYFIIAKKL
jgi:2-polyprenyl-3-methyl-5-hydroxy-6-metoxy-1,4-benzoquinol methylase